MKAKSEATIEGLRELVLRMGALAEAIFAKALRVVHERDGRLAAEVQRDDLALDKLDIEIDDAVLRALALQSPVAEDLRQVIAIKTMATDLERVGDIARNIAKSGARLAERTGPVPRFGEGAHHDAAYFIIAAAAPIEAPRKFGK